MQYSGCTGGVVDVLPMPPRDEKNPAMVRPVARKNTRGSTGSMVMRWARCRVDWLVCCGGGGGGKGKVGGGSVAALAALVTALVPLGAPRAQKQEGLQAA